MTEFKGPIVAGRYERKISMQSSTWFRVSEFARRATGRAVVGTSGGDYVVTPREICVPWGSTEGLVHELCHYAVATPQERPLLNFGLSQDWLHPGWDRMVLAEELAWSLEFYLYGDPSVAEMARLMTPEARASGGGRNMTAGEVEDQREAAEHQYERDLYRILGLNPGYGELERLPDDLKDAFWALKKTAPRRSDEFQRLVEQSKEENPQLWPDEEASDGEDTDEEAKPPLERDPKRVGGPARPASRLTHKHLLGLERATKRVGGPTVKASASNLVSVDDVIAVAIVKQITAVRVTAAAIAEMKRANELIYKGNAVTYDPQLREEALKLARRAGIPLDELRELLKADLVAEKLGVK